MRETLDTWCKANGNYGAKIFNAWTGVEVNESNIDTGKTYLINEVTAGSGRRFKFICNNNHTFYGAINKITYSKRWCSKCNQLKINEQREQKKYKDNKNEETSNNCKISKENYTKQSNKREKLEGKVIGRYKVISYTGNKKYKCECQCSNKTISSVSTHMLKNSKYPCCSKCVAQRSSEIQREKLENTIMYNWEFLEYLGNSKYKCRCTICNREYTVDSREIKRGRSKSCKECSGYSLKDLTNQVFGYYKALEYVGNHYWKCQCLKCGDIKNVTSQQLRLRGVEQCKACAIKDMKRIRREEMLKSWANKRFGLLTPIEYIEEFDCWLCKCKCGNSIEVSRSNLICGHTRSCGCYTNILKNETMLERYKEIATKRIGNPRSLENIQILNNKDKFENTVESLKITLGRTPSSYELAELLDVNYGAIDNAARKYKIDLYDGRCSSQELDFIKLFPEARVHVRNILKNQELDFFFEDIKLAVEINGDYWHSTLFKDKYYHQQKTIDCAKKGIRLIHIFEHEWKNIKSREKIIGIIQGNNKKVIYGRNLEIRKVPNDIAKEFLDKYHMQNGINAAINIAAYCKDELIGIMTFGKPRFNSAFQYEIYRLCWNHKYSVVGGTEKMFNYFLRNYNPQSIITYVDISKFTGKVYTRLGFKPIQPNPITEPNYVWVSSNLKDVLTRYQTQKHILIEQGLGTENQTEDEIMRNAGYFKIYDSGNLKLEWKK